MLPLGEWEELAGPNWPQLRQTIRESALPVSIDPSPPAAPDDPFLRRRLELQRAQQLPAPPRPTQPRPLLPAGARRLPPSPRTPRGAAAAPLAPPRGGALYLMHAQPLCGSAAAAGGFASPRFAQPQLAQPVQGAPAVGLARRPAALPDVPATGHHPSRRRESGAAAWAALPLRWPQHIKTQPELSAATEPGRPPFAVALRRWEAYNERVDVECTLFWNGVDFAELGSDRLLKSAGGGGEADERVAGQAVNVEGDFDAAITRHAMKARLEAGISIDAFDDASLEHRTPSEWIGMATPRPPVEYIGRASAADPFLVANYKQRRLAELAAEEERQRWKASSEQLYLKVVEVRALKVTRMRRDHAAKCIQRHARRWHVSKEVMRRVRPAARPRTAPERSPPPMPPRAPQSAELGVAGREPRASPCLPSAREGRVAASAASHSAGSGACAPLSEDAAAPSAAREASTAALVGTPAEGPVLPFGQVVPLESVQDVDESVVLAVQGGGALPARALLWDADGYGHWELVNAIAAHPSTNSFLVRTISHTADRNAISEISMPTPPRDVALDASGLQRLHEEEPRAYWQEPMSEHRMASVIGTWVHRCRIQFRAEPSGNYIARLESAVDRQQRAEALLRVWLAVECMPPEEIPVLPDKCEQRLELLSSNIHLELSPGASVVRRLRGRRSVQSRREKGEQRSTLLSGGVVQVKTTSSNTDPQMALRRSLGAELEALVRREYLADARRHYVDVMNWLHYAAMTQQSSVTHGSGQTRRTEAWPPPEAKPEVSILDETSPWRKGGLHAVEFTASTNPRPKLPSSIPPGDGNDDRGAPNPNHEEQAYTGWAKRGIAPDVLSAREEFEHRIMYGTRAALELQRLTPRPAAKPGPPVTIGERLFAFASAAAEVCRHTSIHLNGAKRVHGRVSRWLCTLAAEGNDLHALRWLRMEQHCHWDEVTSAKAAEAGSIDCLKYLHAHNCPWDELTCAAAASKGHLNCLLYAREHGCPWDERTCNWAMENDHLRVFLYAWGEGCPSSEAARAKSHRLQQVDVLSEWVKRIKLRRGDRRSGRLNVLHQDSTFTLPRVNA
ncbi:hypothetical protein AB1Y20_005100 [Prymnesium parvum]|uniref:Uncharacterized protein n=1 Tax=Prymnesium parvum TaxID=97485 RepID=A0AB34J5J6_PRYPA